MRTVSHERITLKMRLNMIVRRSREYTLEAPKTLTVYLLFVLFDWFVYFLYVFLISCCHKIQVKEIIVGNGEKTKRNDE